MSAPVQALYGIYRTSKVMAWLERHPHWVCHFMPTPSSWLNAVEGFSTKRHLKRGVFHFRV
jgi:transposase